jgi:hypothetical protein
MTSNPSYFGLDLTDVFTAAATANSDPEYAQGRTTETVTSNAIDSMQPIGSDGGSWSDFWRGAAGTLLNYGITRDAVRNGVQPGAGGAVNQAGQPAQSAPAQSAGIAPGTVLLIGGGLALVGVLVFALRKG